MARKAFIVQSLYWNYNDNWHDVGEGEVVRAFEAWGDAERLRLELEQQARAALDRTPAKHAGGIGRASSCSEEEVLSTLRAWRLPRPPRSRYGDWLDWGDAAWWDAVMELVSDRGAPAYYNRLDEEMTAEETELALEVGPEDVWALFDRVRFYEIVAIELEDA